MISNKIFGIKNFVIKTLKIQNLIFYVKVLNYIYLVIVVINRPQNNYFVLEKMFYNFKVFMGDPNF